LVRATILATAAIVALAGCETPEEAQARLAGEQFCASKGYPADVDDPACYRAIEAGFCAENGYPPDANESSCRLFIADFRYRSFVAKYGYGGDPGAAIAGAAPIERAVTPQQPAPPRIITCSQAGSMSVVCY
jgi:hypothetical protein